MKTGPKRRRIPPNDLGHLIKKVHGLQVLFCSMLFSVDLPLFDASFFKIRQTRHLLEMLSHSTIYKTSKPKKML